MLPEPGFALGADHGRAFCDATKGLTKIARAANERHFESVLPDVVLFVGRSEHFTFVDVVDFERLEHLCLGKMADAHFSHHRD